MNDQFMDIINAKDKVDSTVKTFYAKPAGDFGLVEMSRESKKRIDNLMKLLRLLGCIEPVDRDKLMATWKQYDRTNVRWWGPNDA